jgi:hypothetical protein
VRTILFLHTEAPTRRALARERPDGRLVLASDQIERADLEVFDDAIELPPAEDVAGTVARLKGVAADELVVQTEDGLLAGSWLAQQRGLRAPKPQAALLTTNKWLCREALRAAGLPVPRYALARSADEVKRFAVDRWPVVVKPIASTLGHLVTRIASAAEADAAVARLVAALPRSPHVRRCADFARLARLDMGCDAERQFLVEEFVDGLPLETDGLVFGERVDLFGVTEQVLSAPPFFFIEGYLFPVPRRSIEATSLAAIRALGLSDAGFSIEFRGEVMIEVNGRLGEDAGFPDLFRSELGRFPITKWLDDDADPRPGLGGGHALAYANAYRGGVVRSVRPADGATLLVAPGSRLHAPPHPGTEPHLAYALASHPDGARAAYEAARAQVDRVLIEIDES